MPTHINARSTSTGDLMLAAYRQAWLAGLGAAAAARDWVQADAAPMFRSLVRQGAMVEAQAMRAVDSRIESSTAFANAALQSARRQAAPVASGIRAAVPATVLARMSLPAKRVKSVNPAKPRKVARAGKPARNTAAKRAGGSRTQARLS